MDGTGMSSYKNRDDEVYEKGVQDGQQAGAMDQFSHSLSKGYTLNPHENEIYNAGYAYGVAHRPQRSQEQEESARRHDYDVQESEYQHRDQQSSAANTSGSEALGKLIGYLIVAAIVIWFVFSVAIPLLMINVALIALIAALVRKESGRFLLPLSICGAMLVVADYNNGWFTKTLVSNLSFFTGLIPVFLYVNILAGLISAYFLARNALNKREPPEDSAGEFTKRNLITMGCLLGVGVLAVGTQALVDSKNRHAIQPTPISASISAPAATNQTTAGKAAPPILPSTEWLNKSTGQMWARAGEGSDIDWDKAESYCRNLGAGNYRDWRLPEITELDKMTEPSEPGHMKGSLGRAGDWYWSATKNGREVWGFLYGSLASGNAGTNDPHLTVLCVRSVNAAGSEVAGVPQVAAGAERGGSNSPGIASGPSKPTKIESIAPNEDDSAGSWVDLATGLRWMQKDNGVNVTQPQALAYCQALTVAGFRDWRLPTINELGAIALAAVDDPANAGGYHIKGGIKPTGWLWSSSLGRRSGEAWGINYRETRFPASLGTRSSFPVDSDAVGDAAGMRAVCVR